MSILNKTAVPIIRHAALEQPPKVDWTNFLQECSHRYNWIRNYDDKDYWFIEFANSYSFKFCLDSLLPLDIIEKIKNKEVTLILCNSQHGYHRIIEDIYNCVVINYNIPPEQILLLSNSPDILAEILVVSKEKNRDQIKVEFMIEFEAEAKEVAKSFTTAKNTLEYKEYPKKFLSFNGLPRPHRTAIQLLLKTNNLLHNGYVSYNVRLQDNPTQDPEHWYNQLIGREELSVFFSSFKDDICKLTPIYLDTTPKTHHMVHPANMAKVHLPMYENSYFSLITETAAYKGYSDDGFTGAGRILSEKTFKAIVNQHPFILVAMPRSLEELHDLGYKTFSPWIDESYDQEEDDVKRTFMIMREVKKLCNLDPDELKGFLQFAKEIVVYNYNLLVSKNKWTYPLNYKWTYPLN
jgi:hypothetical protein